MERRSMANLGLWPEDLLLAQALSVFRFILSPGWPSRAKISHQADAFPPVYLPKTGPGTGLPEQGVICDAAQRRPEVSPKKRRIPRQKRGLKPSTHGCDLKKKMGEGRMVPFLRHCSSAPAERRLKFPLWWK